MKTLILLLILLPVTAGATSYSNYYNNYGTYEGTAVSNGQHTNYYNYRGDYMGSRQTTETTPNPAPAYSPNIELTPIPGTYNGILPDTDIIGDPE